MTEISYHLMPDVSENFAPFRAHTTDAGFDLKLAGSRGAAILPNEEFHLPPHQVVLLRTGVGFNIPPGWCGITVGRSSLNAQGVLNVQGLIDSGYQGEVFVGLLNTNDYPVVLRSEQRIAQIVFMPIYAGAMNHVPLDTQVSTERGKNGFGSSDRKSEGETL